MGVLVPGTLTADTRPCPPPFYGRTAPSAPVSEGRIMRYCTYSAGFTHSGVSRTAWSQCFGHVGYCTYPSHMCITAPHRRVGGAGSCGVRGVWAGINARRSLSSVPIG